VFSIMPTFPVLEMNVISIYCVQFSAYSPFLIASTMKLMCPNTGGSLRYRSIPSGGRIACDGSRGCLRSSSKFLAGIETYRRREMSGSFGFLVIGHTFHIRRYAPARRSFFAAMVFWSAKAVGRGSPSSA